MERFLSLLGSNFTRSHYKKRHDFPPTAEFTKVKSLLPILDDFLIWTKQFLFLHFTINIFPLKKKVYIRGLDCYNLFLYLVNYEVSISLFLSYFLISCLFSVTQSMAYHIILQPFWWHINIWSMNLDVTRIGVVALY